VRNPFERIIFGASRSMNSIQQISWLRFIGINIRARRKAPPGAKGTYGVQGYQVLRARY